ncbi:hypothetical protein [Novosphingobium terrae]|uniref:hypothetical protein n=1 Tax=Novosphingobium terrae TaxID=2726189 RepID=UPI00197FAADF|nr:hypothetical protein [Novosphingobium terrae]
MIDPRKQRQTPSFPPPVPTPGAPKKAGGWGPLAFFGAIVVGALALGQCSTSSRNAGSAATDVAQNAIGSAIDAQTAQGVPIVTPLSKSDVQIGMSHLRQVAKAEGLAGEMIYSQNCYDALSRHFTWPKLDQCGAFDLGAAQSLGDGTATGFDKEIAWFQSEAAAGRYIKGATAAGEEAEKADVRLNDLQTRVTAGHPVGFKGEQPAGGIPASADAVAPEAAQ